MLNFYLHYKYKCYLHMNFFSKTVIIINNLKKIIILCIGEKARNFFIQSGLPQSVLAEIWWETLTMHNLFKNKYIILLWWLACLFVCGRTLADMNKDGRMDRLEFSIAMKLIKMKLQGQNLPTALPIIMKQPPVPAPTMPATPLGALPNYTITSRAMIWEGIGIITLALWQIQILQFIVVITDYLCLSSLSTTIQNRPKFLFYYHGWLQSHMNAVQTSIFSVQQPGPLCMEVIM